MDGRLDGVEAWKEENRMNAVHERCTENCYNDVVIMVMMNTWWWWW